MDTDRIQNMLTSFMVVSFIIFLGLSGLIFVREAELTNRAVSLPFAFLFLCITTLIVTGKIHDQPSLAGRHLRSWLIVSVFGVLLAAVAFTLA